MSLVSEEFQASRSRDRFCGFGSSQLLGCTRLTEHHSLKSQNSSLLRLAFRVSRPCSARTCQNVQWGVTLRATTPWIRPDAIQTTAVLQILLRDSSVSDSERIVCRSRLSRVTRIMFKNACALQKIDDPLLMHSHTQDEGRIGDHLTSLSQ